MVRRYLRSIHRKHSPAPKNGLSDEEIHELIQRRRAIDILDKFTAEDLIRRALLEEKATPVELKYVNDVITGRFRPEPPAYIPGIEGMPWRFY